MRDSAVRKVYTAERGGKLPNGIGSRRYSNDQLLVAIGHLQALVSEAGTANGAAPGALPQAADTSAPEGVSEIVAEPEHAESEVREVRRQIGEMAKTIDRTKLEIAAIKHPLASNDPMHSASSQLDAIVSATESATQSILDATEQVEEILKRIVSLDPHNGEILGLSEEAGGHLIRVMEACGFQDITGQRVTKVVNTLRFIEEKVAAVIEIWGTESFDDIPVDPNDEAEDKGDEILMNGPQLEGQGISQADIDALFD